MFDKKSVFELKSICKSLGIETNKNSKKIELLSAIKETGLTDQEILDAIDKAFSYKEAEDVVRFQVKPETTSNSTENFTINIANITPETATISLKWAKTLVNIPFSTDIKTAIRAQVKEATSGANVNPNVYQAAANFYYDMDKDYDNALVFVDKAIAANAKAYWLLLLKGKVQKELGDKKGAIASAEACKKTATEEKNDDYVRNANELLASLK